MAVRLWEYLSRSAADAVESIGVNSASVERDINATAFPPSDTAPRVTIAGPWRGRETPQTVTLHRTIAAGGIPVWRLPSIGDGPWRTRVAMTYVDRTFPEDTPARRPTETERKVLRAGSPLAMHEAEGDVVAVVLGDETRVRYVERGDIVEAQP